MCIRDSLADARHAEERHQPPEQHAGDVQGPVPREATEAALRRSEGMFRELNAELESRVSERTAQLELANRELESFCHSVSHDLRAPLRHLDGFAGLLLEDCRDALSPDGLRYVDTIAAAAKKMGVLIDDLLQFSRTSRQEMGTRMVDMAVVVQEALLPLRETQEGAKVEWVIGELPNLRGDHNLLRQVWANLLENAIKYSRNRESPRVEIRSWTEGEEIRFAVSDNLSLIHISEPTRPY